MEGEKLVCYVCERLKTQSEFTVALEDDNLICNSCKEKWISDMKNIKMADYFNLRYENLKMKRCIRALRKPKGCRTIFKNSVENKSLVKIGYIQRYDLDLNPHLTERFKFVEASASRTINSRGDKIKSKILWGSVDYSEVEINARLMHENPKLIIVCEPFLLDEELKMKCLKWVEWANTAHPSEYEPFYDSLDAEELKIKAEAEADRITASGIGQAFNPD